MTSIAPYERIAGDLRARIASGQWAVGAMLPGRRTLAQEYGVELPTLQRAVAGLLADGTLRADGTRGTFVAARPGPPIPRPANVPIILARLDSRVSVGVVAGIRPHDDRQGGASRWNEIITNSIERTITEAGATARFFNLNRPDGSYVTPAQGVEALLAEGVEAIILALVPEPDLVPEAARLAAARQTPLVVIADGKSSRPLLSVCFDSTDAGYQAAQHLLSRGYPDLLFFAPYTTDWVQERLAGTRRAAHEAGLPAQSVRAAVSDEPVERVMSRAFEHQAVGYAFARTLLAEGLPARGVVAANDLVALGFLRAAGEAGLMAGRDFALVGFDDIPQAREAGLTSLHPPLEGLGQEAARLALRALEGHTAPLQVCLHSHLISRSSSCFPLSLARFGGFAEPSSVSLISTHERGIFHDTAILSTVF